MKGEYDIAVVGSGFGGSLLAMIARRLGYSVILIERDRHPRFAIGESSTPLANLLWEELADRYSLHGIRPLARWGSWQSELPRIPCGLKRGFSFFHHRQGERFTDDISHRNQLLVGASPNNRIADTHWYRPAFDEFLVREAGRMGVACLDQTHLSEVHAGETGLELEGGRGDKKVRIQARLLIDASGPRGFLQSRLQLPESGFHNYPGTTSWFAHFRGVRRWEECMPAGEDPPFPVDDAALHHVFDGGWIWVLRFNNGIVSAGASVTHTLAATLAGNDGLPAWNQLIGRFPSIQHQFENAVPVTPVFHMESLSWRSESVTGAHWVRLPSAVGFVDPLLSTGFPLTLLGIGRLARILEEGLPEPATSPSIQEFARQTIDELELTARLVGALFRNMDDFSRFSRLLLLYFAAASYSECARRLGRFELADGFLLSNHPSFRRNMEQICANSTHDRDRADPEGAAEWMRGILEVVGPIDVAGLSRPDRRNWHPVLVSDLLDNTHKLGAEPAEVNSMLHRCGLDPRETAEGAQI